ncbi:short-chain dehydrogenase [Opitutaceae bacterium EW11]|nr:short-chain dehydrogenase [Opitutaceae bacterium EW11]
MTQELDGKRVVVMGGGSGIGLAAAKSLAGLGARVIVTGRSEEKLQAAVRDAGVPLEHAAFDAGSEPSVRAFFDRVGAVDHLVLTLSGAKGGGLFREVAIGSVREGFEAKFFPHFLAAQLALPHLARDGSITFVSAISARGSMPGTAGLAAINGAIEAMVRPLARELKPLRVNAVSPGVVETPWWDALPAGQRQAFLQSAASMTLVGRNAKPEEAAAAIVFVVTNGFVTGTVIEVDGGVRLS